VSGRRRCQDQLQRVNNSLCIIESHANAIEGTELNKSILDTIRASGDAIKRLSVKGGMSTVEDIIPEVEAQMENASEITKVISAGNFISSVTHVPGFFTETCAGNISGSMNSMGGLDGFGDHDLEEELEELFYEEGDVLKVCDLACHTVKLCIAS
jgi:hypothetical protein